MRPVTVVVTGIGVSAVIPIDIYLAPANIGVGVDISATATFAVQYTFDDVFSPTFDPGTAQWFNHPTLVGSADVDGNFMAPPRGIRLNVSASTGTVTMRLVQAGATG